MTRKSARIATMIQSHHGHGVDPHYAGYFHCFNHQLFYEAHDVLENLWLADKHGANGAFYKGLIQLAGAFVHLQKNRLRPSASLFKLARTNIEKYPLLHERLNLERVLVLIKHWLNELESHNFEVNPLNPKSAPRLTLESA